MESIAQAEEGVFKTGEKKEKQRDGAILQRDCIV